MANVTLADFLTMLSDELAVTAAGTTRVTEPGEGAAAVRMTMVRASDRRPARDVKACMVHLLCLVG